MHYNPVTGFETMGRKNGVALREGPADVPAGGEDDRRLMVQRVATSRYLNRSARLRDLLVYPEVPDPLSR